MVKDSLVSFSTLSTLSRAYRVHFCDPTPIRNKRVLWKFDIETPFSKSQCIINDILKTCTAALDQRMLVTKMTILDEPLFRSIRVFGMNDWPGAKTINKNKNSTQNKSQTQHARAYKVTSFLSTECELSTETCSKNVFSSEPRVTYLGYMSDLRVVRRDRNLHFPRLHCLLHLARLLLLQLGEDWRLAFGERRHLLKNCCLKDEDRKGKKGKSMFYIAQYPVCWTAQSALHFSSPGRPVHSDTNSTNKHT